MLAQLRIGIVAGEASGDQLGAGLIPALREYWPDASFEGVGGERMIAQGFESLYPMDRLSVMGFIEPLKRLPELLRMRRNLVRHFQEQCFDLVLGIDSPEFNLGLEHRLRRAGIATAHYVSPQIWAWRQGRVKNIARAVDLVLTLFPFESEFYHTRGVPVTFVGHPLADQMPLTPDPGQARRHLGLPADGKILAVMPGSRTAEVALMGPLFLQVVRWLRQRHPEVVPVIAAVDEDRACQLQTLLADNADLGVHLVTGQSHRVMTAADAVLLTSGTTALEAMLLKKPMVVSYKLDTKTYWLLSKLVKTPYISLPNLIAGRELIPEFIQGAATVDALGQSLLTMLFDESRRQQLVTAFTAMHLELRSDASRTAAKALVDLVRERSHAG